MSYEIFITNEITKRRIIIVIIIAITKLVGNDFIVIDFNKILFFN